MKRCLVLLMLLFCSTFFGQNVEYSILVKDIETQLPIENATVVIMKTKQILLSNAEGKVNFAITGISNIQLFMSGYETETLRWATLKQNEFIIYLKPKKSKLDEIILSKESPHKILRKIVSNSIQKMAPSYRLKVYVREFCLLNGRYSYYNDGLVNFQFAMNKKNIFTTLLVEQNRSYGLLDTDISANLKGYNLNNIMENYCSFKYFQPILEAKATKEYDFTIRRYNLNKNYNVIAATPFDPSKKSLDNFEIIYDADKKIIIEFTVKNASEKSLKSEPKLNLASKKITSSLVKVKYRLDGLNYYLLSSNEEIGYDIALKDTIKNIQVRNNFVTTNFNKQKFTHNESDVFKEKTLFNKQNNILTNYWDVSGITPTQQEKEIIKKLEFKM